MKTHLPPVNYYRYVPMVRDFIETCITRFGDKLPSDPARVLPQVKEVFARYHPFMDAPEFSRDQVATLISDSDCLKTFYRWWASGRNIFVFTNEVVQAFMQTDVDDVPSDIIKLPYECCFFKFGTVTDISTIEGQDRYLDGAYLYTNPLGGIGIEITQCSKNCEQGGIGRAFYLDLSHTKTVGEALAVGLRDMRDHAREQETDSALGDMAKFFSDMSEQRRDIFESGLPLYKVITRLVVNCIAFLNFEKDDVTDDYLGAPKSMVNKLERSETIKEKRRNISKLLGIGFSKVKLCGRNFARSLIEGEVGDVRAHWRRGHWRRQPCGPHLSVIRLTWVRPTIVRADKGMPETGHIYQA